MVRAGFGCARLAAAMLALVLPGCSDDAEPAGGAANGNDAGESHEDGGGSGAAAGRGASGAGAGRGGASGRGGEGGAGASAGTSGVSGRGGDGGAASAGAGGDSAGGGGDGEGGSAGQADVDDSCESDGDCVLCTLPLSGEMPCCDGCPVVKSQAQCDAERAAAADEDCKPGLLPVCPTILCVAPGSPKCEAGTCISVPGLEQ